MTQRVMVRLSRLVVLTILIATLGACAQEQEPFTEAQISERYGDVEQVFVQEPVEFTNQPYSFMGPSSIEDLLNVIPPNSFVFYGFAPEDEHPLDDVLCEGMFDNISPAPELPMVVEGVVTLHPRYFIKPTFCGEDERYYGSYLIQDSTGGIMVFKDSRIADFQMGDRVRLNVRGLYSSFDTPAVLAHDPAEVLESDQPIYYEEVDRELEITDIGKVKRFTGKVGPGGLPTNQNFNEMCLVRPEDDSPERCGKFCTVNTAETACASENCVEDFPGAGTGRCAREDGYWLVSLDREIGQRQPRIIEEGDVIEVTGPVVDSFGLSFLIARWGQLRFIE